MSDIKNMNAAQMKVLHERTIKVEGSPCSKFFVPELDAFEDLGNYGILLTIVPVGQI